MDFEEDNVNFNLHLAQISIVGLDLWNLTL
jgi:hypothetical protein